MSVPGSRGLHLLISPSIYKITIGCGLASDFRPNPTSTFGGSLKNYAKIMRDPNLDRPVRGVLRAPCRRHRVHGIRFCFGDHQP